MAWQSQSTRHSQLPGNWATLRRTVLERDHYTCTIADHGCLGTATDVDHVGDNNNHHPRNLRSACRPCHNRHTAQQSAAARGTRTYRDPELHPGTRRTT